MAAQIKTLTFAARQGIPQCTRVSIHFTQGNWICEYVPMSEVQITSGAWQYQFYVQENDAPNSMTLLDFDNCNVENLVPYFHCSGWAEEPPEEENDCPARELSCFNGVEILETLPEGAYLGALVYDEVCDTFCLKAYLAEEITDAEAPVERMAFDYEVFSPNEALESAMSTYVTHWPRPFNVAGGLRVSVAQFGAGSLIVRFTVNGNDLTIANITIPPGQRTVVIANGALNPLYQSGNPIPLGAEILATVVSASYDQYGTNWEGLRLALLGQFTA